MAAVEVFSLCYAAIALFSLRYVDLAGGFHSLCAVCLRSSALTHVADFD
jgi:hypothetical protein